MTTFVSIANTMARSWYSSCRIRSIENVPGPTIMGKAKGTTDAVMVSESILKMEIFKHISKPNSSMMILPAKIKEGVLIANNFRIEDPPIRKQSIKRIDTMAIFLAWMVFPFFRMLTATAILPGTLSVANKIQQQEKNC